ncbi:MAG TPA: rod-binding protein [Paracoccaceae bacterium]|nr:rod-binding protein [Paracoccaceae bacterium]
MAINPISDIVLEVARAADPAGLRMATSRLEAMADGAPPLDFDSLTERRPGPLLPRLPFDAAGSLVHLRNNHTLGARKADPYQQFEAHLLQTFIESMLPDEGSTLYGAGTAGEIWKSMLAEGMAAELARSGGIGIARILAAEHESTSENPLSASDQASNEATT